jgi:hypothetical protein
MAAVGVLKYAIDLLSGDVPPPIKNTQVSEGITTIQKFGLELNDGSIKNWKDTKDAITKMDNAYRTLYGKSVFSSAYQTDLKNFNTSWLKGKSKDVHSIADMARLFQKGINGEAVIAPSPEEYDAFFIQELNWKGEDYIFQRDHKADFDNRENPIGKAYDEVKQDIKYQVEVSDALATYKALKDDLIDPNTVYGRAEDVPHDEENTAKIHAFDSESDKGLVGKLLTFLKNNPTRFNASTVSKAIENENLFMKMVHDRWDEPSINKAIREGDASGAFKNFFGEGVSYVEDTVTDGVDDIMGSDLNPVKPFWDLLKDLWENAGSYIEYVFIFIVVIALIWIAGEIKYVAT